MVVPDLDDTEHARLVFGDFVLAATTSMGELCAFYGLDLPCDADKTVGQWLADSLHRPPVHGDTAHLGQAEISVRTTQGNRITQVGIRITRGGFKTPRSAVQRRNSATAFNDSCAASSCGK